MLAFTRTQEAAKTDKQSKWDLIEAIALDAVDNGVGITSHDSIAAAAVALEAAGNDYSRNVVRNLCQVAKFDLESTATQRRVWRRYGWSIVLEAASAGWSQETACEFLMGSRKSRKRVREAIGNAGVIGATLSEAWHTWVSKLDRILADGATLAERSETETIDLHAEFARLVYERITESKIDTELRELIETEGAA